MYEATQRNHYLITAAATPFNRHETNYTLRSICSRLHFRNAPAHTERPAPGAGRRPEGQEFFIHERQQRHYSEYRGTCIDLYTYLHLSIDLSRCRCYVIVFLYLFMILEPRYLGHLHGTLVSRERSQVLA